MIVITTPTGTIGHQVLEKVLNQGEPVRVIVRDAARLPAGVREQVEIVEGSHGDADVVNRAFAGADSVFWVAPPNLQASSLEEVYVDFNRPACEAFQRHEVKRVVVVSSLGRGWPRPAGLVSGSVMMDDMIASTGVNCRILTMPSFMDNMLRQVQPIKSQGVFFSPLSPDLKVPTCATRDIASVAARLLLDHGWSGQEEVPVLGPEDLSCNDLARILSEVLGKPVRYQQVPFDAYKETLLQAGASEAMANAFIEMMVAKNEGSDNMEPRTPESTTPTSFRQWCEEVLKPAVLSQ